MPADETHMWGIVYILAINFATFITFGWDKYCAQRNKWRVKESTLLLMAFLGGAMGGLLGQRQFRHKTQKQPFKSFLYVYLALNFVVGIALLFPNVRGHVLETLRSVIG